MTVPFCEETRNRIRVSVAAYAYEILDEPIMSDGEFDALCLKIDPYEPTGNALMDEFFMMDFDPSTGSWIHRHPDLEGIEAIHDRYYKRDDDFGDLI